VRGSVRGETAELSLPDERTLAAVHFQIVGGTDRGSVRLLDALQVQVVRGKDTIELTSGKQPETEIYPGDRIQAGGVAFEVQLLGDRGVISQAGTDAQRQDGILGVGGESALSTWTGPAPLELCDQLELDATARNLATKSETVDRFVVELAEHDQFPAAIRVQAALMDHRLAVRWGARCLREAFGDSLPPGQAVALETAEAWCEDASETRRRAAHAAAEATGYEGAACWVALAAYWSGGSIAPPGLSEVFPDPGSRGRP
jgi:hypothetical protein